MKGYILFQGENIGLEKTKLNSKPSVHSVDSNMLKSIFKVGAILGEMIFKNCLFKNRPWLVVCKHPQVVQIQVHSNCGGGGGVDTWGPTRGTKLCIWKKSYSHELQERAIWIMLQNWILNLLFKFREPSPFFWTHSKQTDCIAWAPVNSIHWLYWNHPVCLVHQMSSHPTYCTLSLGHGEMAQMLIMVR